MPGGAAGWQDDRGMFICIISFDSRFNRKMPHLGIAVLYNRVNSSLDDHWHVSCWVVLRNITVKVAFLTGA